MNFNLDSSKFVQDDIMSTSPLSTTSQLTKMFRHGGVYSALDKNAMQSRLSKISSNFSLSAEEESFNLLAELFSSKMNSFFFRFLENNEHLLSNDLIEYLSEKGTGRLFSQNDEIKENNRIPTFMIFVGQFIDHDLTLNPINLIGRAGNPGDDDNGASPVIDLDSVYGSRDHLRRGELWHIINNTDGKFKLNKIEDDIFDLPRDKDGLAYMFDFRNDENQIISQIHILIMRLHNKLAEKFEQPDPNSPESVSKFVNDVRKEVLRNWQSFVWNEYLPTLIETKALRGAIKHIEENKLNGMPHEFSIGFRMGHSQLRPFYKLNHYPPITLFDRNGDGTDDLRGDKALNEKHAIDWKFFIDKDKSGQTSNQIDTQITQKVFDLPDSTIPDDNKQIINLAKRNLLRSNQLKIAHAEKLAEYFNLKEEDILTPDQIEPDKDKQYLFIQDDEFKTPLWFYILKESEVFNNGEQLGPLGGRIVGLVISGAILNQKESFLEDPTWISKITNSNKVKFEDMVDFVLD